MVLSKLAPVLMFVAYVATKGHSDVHDLCCHLRHSDVLAQVATERHAWLRGAAAAQVCVDVRGLSYHQRLCTDVHSLDIHLRPSGCLRARATTGGDTNLSALCCP